MGTYWLRSNSIEKLKEQLKNSAIAACMRDFSIFKGRTSKVWVLLSLLLLLEAEALLHQLSFCSNKIPKPDPSFLKRFL